MRGSIRKRCQCRDTHGQQIKSCRKNHGSWSYTLDTGTGKQRKQITRSGYRTRDEAQEALTATLNAHNTGTWTNDTGLTVNDWLTQWLAEARRRGMSPKTIAGYHQHIRDTWSPTLGNLRLRDLRRSHVEQVIGQLIKPTSSRGATGNIGRRVERRSAATVDGYRRTLRAALAAAVRRDLILINPAVGRIDALPRPEVEHELVIWEPHQTAQFLTHVAVDRLAALYELAAYTGLRRAELCGLRWTDLDPDGSGLTVRQTLLEMSRREIPADAQACPTCDAQHVGRFFKQPKSRAGRRWIPLAPPAQTALAQHQIRQSKDRTEFGPDYTDHGLIFALPDGNPLRPGSVTTAFEAHVRACGLPKIRLHDTRHGACSLMLAGNVPLPVVQMIMGHSSPAVTQRVYAHVMRTATADQISTASELLTKHRRGQSVSKTAESDS
jgi:integrase